MNTESVKDTAEIPRNVSQREKDLNRRVFREDTQMARKHMKR